MGEPSPKKPPKGALLARLESVVGAKGLITDPIDMAPHLVEPRGRYRGAARGPCVGHVGPEAAEGGPIGLVEDGDLVEIDIPERKLNLLVDDAVLAERRKTWVPPEPKVRGGFLEVYRRNVSSADKGAVFGPMDD